MIIEVLQRAVDELRPNELRTAHAPIAPVTALLLQPDERYLAPLAVAVCNHAAVTYRAIPLSKVQGEGRSSLALRTKIILKRLANRAALVGTLGRLVGVEPLWHGALVRRFARQSIRVACWEGIRDNDAVVGALRARSAGVIALAVTCRRLRVLDQGVARVSCAEFDEVSRGQTLNLDEALDAVPDLTYRGVDLRAIFMPRAA